MAADNLNFNTPIQDTYDRYQKRGMQGAIARDHIPPFFDQAKVGSLGAYTMGLLPGQPVTRNATTGMWDPQDDVTQASHILGLERTAYNTALTPQVGNQSSYVVYGLNAMAKGMINGSLYLLVNGAVNYNQYLAWDNANAVWEPAAPGITESRIVVQALTSATADGDIIEAYVYQSFLTTV
jgi:hypothetical protein